MALAPMADVTDFAYREIFAKYGKPDVTWTEFISCDGLANSKGRRALVRNLTFSDTQRPIVAQIFGSNPDTFYEAAKLMKKLGFDGIDINMGCPEKSVCKSGSGAALIQTPGKAKEIILATKRGAGDLPVSVKIRTGYNQVGLTKWLEALIEVEPAAIIIHGRTKKEMSKVPADWELMGEAVHDLREKYAHTELPLFIGNGDVESLAEAKSKAKQFALDGVMVGRGTFGNPWFFASHSAKKSLKGKLKVMLEHAQLYEQTTGKFKPFDLMKKHFKAYITGFDGAKELRIKLMDAKNAAAVAEILRREKYL